MNTKTPLILISNDDGYQAPGINKLVDMLRPLDVKIFVCAPDGPRSGYSCAFSSELPLSGATTKWMSGHAMAHQ